MGFRSSGLRPNGWTVELEGIRFALYMSGCTIVDNEGFCTYEIYHFELVEVCRMSSIVQGTSLSGWQSQYFEET